MKSASRGAALDDMTSGSVGSFTNQMIPKTPRLGCLRLAQLLTAALLATMITACGSTTAPEGFYLTEGGMNYLEIDRDPKGRLFISRERSQRHQSTYLEITTSGERLKFEYVFDWSSMMRIASGAGTKRSIRDWFRDWVDWVRERTKTGTYDYLVYRASGQTPDDWDLERVALDRYSSLGRSSSPELKFKDLPQPVRSAFHRVHDPRVMRYFDLQDTQQNGNAARELADGLLGEAPDSLWIRTLYLDSLIADADLEELEQKLDEWEGDYQQDSNPWMNVVPRRGRRLLEALRADAAGLNAATRYAGFFPANVKHDLASLVEELPGILECENFIPIGRGFADPGIPPNFLQLQTMAKTFRVLSVFRMLEGRRDEALVLLATSYQIGQYLVEQGPSIHLLIGTALRRIAIGGLLVQGLNACETEEEFQRLWSYLERFNAQTVTVTRQKLLNTEWILNRLSARCMVNKTKSPTVWMEIEVRPKVAEAKFQLLRMATASRHRLVTQGDFPNGAEPFAPLLPGGPPADPFGDDPLRYVTEDDRFICFSVGPDREDGKAQIHYDPTNGTFSAGDVIIEVPRRREFPFPREGTQAPNAQALMDQYPNGLPLDPFAGNKGRSLNVTDTLPVHVFSFGPHTDEAFPSVEAIYAWSDRENRWLTDQEWQQKRRIRFQQSAPSSMFPGMASGGPIPRRGARGRPDVTYDPSNGTTSRGDLYIVIPP